AQALVGVSRRGARSDAPELLRRRFELSRGSLQLRAQERTLTHAAAAVHRKGRTGIHSFTRAGVIVSERMQDRRNAFLQRTTCCRLQANASNLQRRPVAIIRYYESAAQKERD